MLLLLLVVVSALVLVGAAVEPNPPPHRRYRPTPLLKVCHRGSYRNSSASFNRQSLAIFSPRFPIATRSSRHLGPRFTSYSSCYHPAGWRRSCAALSACRSTSTRSWKLASLPCSLGSCAPIYWLDSGLPFRFSRLHSRNPSCSIALLTSLVFNSRVTSSGPHTTVVSSSGSRASAHSPYGSTAKPRVFQLRVLHIWVYGSSGRRSVSSSTGIYQWPCSCCHRLEPSRCRSYCHRGPCHAAWYSCRNAILHMTNRAPSRLCTVMSRSLVGTAALVTRSRPLSCRSFSAMGSHLSTLGFSTNGNRSICSRPAS